LGRGEFTVYITTNNTITIYPNAFNNSGSDYVMVLTVTAGQYDDPYPSEEITVTQYSQ
jgi:hypothetical protein